MFVVDWLLEQWLVKVVKMHEIDQLLVITMPRWVEPRGIQYSNCAVCPSVARVFRRSLKTKR